MPVNCRACGRRPAWPDSDGFCKLCGKNIRNGRQSPEPDVDLAPYIVQFRIFTSANAFIEEFERVAGAMRTAELCARDRPRVGALTAEHEARRVPSELAGDGPGRDTVTALESSYTLLRGLISMDADERKDRGK